MSKSNTSIHPLINEVENRMQAQLAGNPSTVIASLGQLIQIGENLTRPTLTLLFGNMFGLKRDILIDLTASIEMLHLAKLVHDNLAKKSSGQIPRTPFITSATVLTGDVAFAAAARLATAPQSTTVMRIFSETLQLMVSGEITQMFQNGSSFERGAYYHRIHAQTASLFELACQATAILAEMEDEIVNIARQFGYEIGMAFQIIQDILGFIADTKTSGGSVGNNLHLGIVALPTIYYLETHPHDPDFLSLVNHNGNEAEDIERLIKAIRQSDAIKQALDEAKAYIQRGIEALVKLPNTPERVKVERLATQIIPSDL
jgi:geranylgeranyl pyrophosphate synthase